jgi:hypothetical protein
MCICLFVHTCVHMSSKTSVRAHDFKTSDMEQRQQGSEISRHAHAPIMSCFRDKYASEAAKERSAGVDVCAHARAQLKWL